MMENKKMFQTTNQISIQENPLQMVAAVAVCVVLSLGELDRERCLKQPTCLVVFNSLAYTGLAIGANLINTSMAACIC